MEPSGEMRGEKEEQAKLELTFLEKCQKERKEEPERLLHFLRRNEFFVSRRIDFVRFRDEI